MADEAEEGGGADEAPEIIAKPPSHPVTTTLLGTSIVGTLICIILVWSELFGSYMPAASGKGMEKHKAVDEAKKQGSLDHYAEDYPGKDSLWYEVGKDLKVNTEGASN